MLDIDERKAETGSSGSLTDYFVMIVHVFSLPVKLVRIDTYYFQLMSVLVILQVVTSVVFAFNLSLMLPELFVNKLGFWTSQEMQDFWANDLV